MSEAATKECPFCAETIRAAATLCRFCGRELPLPGHAAVPSPPVSPAPLPDASGAMPLRQSEVLDLLSALVQKSLVVYEEDEQGRGRYRLLETVRQYARDRLQEAGEWAAGRDQHARFCLQLAEAAHAAAGQGMSAEAFERLEPEHDNLRAALAYSGEGMAERMLRLAGALGEFWFEHGYWDEGRHWLERALASAPDAESTAERARALAATGLLATNQPDYPAARNLLEESIALYRALGDTRGLVEALTYLSAVLRWRYDDVDAARPVQEEAVALARTLGEPCLVALALKELGMVMLGEPQTARVLLEESLALARQVGDQGLMAQCLERLGWMSQLQGDGAKARTLLEESVELARAAKNQNALFWARHFLAGVLFEQGDRERANSLGEENLLLARALHMPSLVGVAIARLAAHAPSDEEALQRIEAAAREYGPQAAISPFAALGHAARERGDYEWAATCYRRSLAFSQEVGFTLGIANRLEEFAGLAARQQQWERAARLLGAAEGVSAAMGRRRPIAIPAEYERAVQGTRRALGEEAFAAAWAAGRALPLAQAIRVALEECEIPTAGGKDS